METLRLTFLLNYTNFLAKPISFCPLTRGTVLYWSSFPVDGVFFTLKDSKMFIGFN